MVDVVASNGRFGPYLKRGKETCSIPETHSVLTVTLEESNVLFANKTKSRTPAVLKKWSHEGVEIELKKGRYGPYVTNGKVNASIPKSVEIDAITAEQAHEWIKVKAASPAKYQATGSLYKLVRPSWNYYLISNVTHLNYLCISNSLRPYFIACLRHFAIRVVSFHFPLFPYGFLAREL